MLPTEIVRGLYDALQRGDIPALFAPLNDDLSPGPSPQHRMVRGAGNSEKEPPRKP